MIAVPGHSTVCLRDITFTTPKQVTRVRAQQLPSTFQGWRSEIRIFGLTEVGKKSHIGLLQTSCKHSEAAHHSAKANLSVLLHVFMSGIFWVFLLNNETEFSLVHLQTANSVALRRICFRGKHLKFLISDPSLFHRRIYLTLKSPNWHFQCICTASATSQHRMASSAC